MTDENKNKNNDDINELISKLIVHLNELKPVTNETSVPPPPVMLDDIEVEAGTGTPIKINSRTYFRMMYSEVENLKKDTESLLSLYLDDVKPRLVSMDASLKVLTKNYKTVETDVGILKTEKPKSFKTWMEDKSKFAESAVSLGKFMFWLIAIIWMLSAGLPNLVTIVQKIAGV